MTPVRHKFIKLPILLISILFLCIHPAVAKPVRKPVYSGSFYPNDPDRLTAQITELTKLADQTSIPLPADAALKAMILPHAGYIYSGFTAAHASTVLKNRELNKVIILGPDHRIGFPNCVISDVSAYETPLGEVFMHPDCRYLKQMSPSLFGSIAAVDDQEHSIEVQIPFLQHYLDHFTIVPIVMGPGDAQKYADAIDCLLSPETLIVASSDLSHYLPYDQAVQTDQATIEHILALNIDKLSESKYSACGIIPIQVLTHLAIRHHWEPILLHYSNSGDTAGPKNRVVGYAAIAYIETANNNIQKGSIQMDKQKGELLLRLARKTIESTLNPDASDNDNLNDVLSDEIFNARRGTFVTLKINDRLRGCIGNLTPDKSIAEGVKDNALNAAFHDPRFPPLSREELGHVDIEISLLSEPERLDYRNGDDLLEKLRPNVDGLIIRKGACSATFLPQVWEQLPDKKAFLSHLCQKAGLPPDAWRGSGLEVMTYQVQYFEEDQ